MLNIEIHPSVDCIVGIGNDKSIKIMPGRNRSGRHDFSPGAPVTPAHKSFVLLDKDGDPIEDGDNHSLIYDPSTELVWSRTLSSERVTHDRAKRIAEDLGYMGGGFRLPTIQELLTLVDYSRHDPAIDGRAFPDCHAGWYWTSSLYAGGEAYAWCVSFYRGGSLAYRRGYRFGFVRAVRGARQ